MSGPLEANLLGYAVYVAAILAPGYGLGELFGRWKPTDSLSERFGFAFGYGLAADTVVVAFKTIGLRVGGFALLGIPPWLVYLLVAMGVGAFLLSFALRKGVAGPPTVSTLDLGVVAIAGVMAVASLLYFAKYPIFPYYYDIDFLVHTLQAHLLTTGAMGTVPHMVLYGAATYQIAIATAMVGGVGLVTAQRSMAFLVVFSPFLVYAVSAKLLGSRRAALIVIVLYAVGGNIWAPMVYVSGLYANFVGVLLELLLVAAFLSLAEDIRSPSTWFASGMVMVAGYFSHYTVVAVLGSFVLMTAVVALGRKGNYRGYLLTTGFFLAPGALGAVVYRHLLGSMLAISYKSGSTPSLTTYLSNLLVAVPSVSFLAVDLNNDAGFVALIALLGVAMYKGYRSKYLLLLLPLLWFFGLLVVAPQNHAAWRFSFEAILPLLLLAGYGLHMLIPQRRARKTVRATKGDFYRLGVILALLLFIVPIVANAWTATMVENSLIRPQAEVQVQGNVYQAIVWMGQNINPGTVSLSVTDPRFTFSKVLVGVNSTYQYFNTQAQALQYAQANGDGYVIVTRYDVHLTENYPAPNDSSTKLPWFTFAPSSSMALVYNNPDVRIYQVNSTG